MRPFVSNVTADYLVDRRKLRRQLTTWRIAAFALAAVAVLVAAVRFGSFAALSRPHIAKLELTGIITGDEDTLKKLRDIGGSSAVAAILEIDSPGGTTEGSEVLYDEIRRLEQKKPVVAVVGGVAASGAYIAALGADRIFAHGNSIVGSIGVLVQYPNFAGLLDKVGVKYESIKSSPLKASPNGFEPTSDAARDAIGALIADSFAWFKGLVRERRGLNDEELAKVDDGRVFNGRQGLPLKLIDAIGGERDAIDWLEREKGVAKNLPVRDWSPPPDFAGFRMKSIVADIAEAAGWRPLADGLRHVSSSASGSVDGLMSVWQLSSGD
jgi:protease-4